MTWILLNAFAVFFCWLFIKSATQKLLSFRSSTYVEIFQDLHDFSSSLVKYVIVFLGCLEMLFALLLLVPKTQQLALVLLFVLLWVYSAYIAIQVMRGRSGMACGCAGPKAELKINIDLLWRNGGLLLLNLIAVLLASIPAVEPVFGQWLLACALAAVLIVLHLCVELLLVNQHKLRALRSPKLS